MAKHMGKIVTVQGEKEADSSKFFQCHEHLLIAWGTSGEINPDLYFDDVKMSMEEVQTYKAAGGCGIVDAQPVGCGRMAEGLKKISRVCGIDIVASTGFHKMTFYPRQHWIFAESEEWLANLFLQELEHGMYVDGDQQRPTKQILAKAGQIKTAMETSEIDDQYRKLFTAAARAAKSTGAPLMVHVENGTTPMRYFELLVNLKVEPQQMIFCHLDRACKDLSVHKELAAAGAFLEYDTIAREKYHSDEEELQIFLEMIDAGYSEQLLFSLDTTRKRLKSYGGTAGLDYILKTFISKMHSAGIAAESIDQIAKINPSRALAWK